MYTLIGSTTSPYVRKLRLLFADKKVAYEFKAINYLEENDALFLKNINPINKIPILLIDGKPLYDSRVIYNYLSQENICPKLSIEEENILSAIDAAMDSSINLFSLRRGGLDLKNCNNPYIKRQEDRVYLILDYLLPWIKKESTSWNFLTMSLYSYIYWGQFREILSLESYPEFNTFLEKNTNRPGIIETDIPR
jgi:glutathione S-transferase